MEVGQAAQIITWLKGSAGKLCHRPFVGSYAQFGQEFGPRKRQVQDGECSQA